MFNKAIYAQGSGQIKYIIASSAMGYLDMFQPSVGEGAVFLNEQDYFMAMREPGNYMVQYKTEWVDKKPVMSEHYEMVMIAGIPSAEPEVKAEPPKKELPKKEGKAKKLDDHFKTEKKK